MSKVILFIIFTLSINALTQTNQPMMNKHNIKLNFIEEDLDNKYDGVWNTFDSFSENNLEHVLKHQTFQPLKLISLNDSIYNWQWDAQNMEWIIDLKIIEITYNDNHYQISGLYQHLYGSTWLNSSKITYTYDANNNLTSILFQNWINNNWVNESKNTYLYDANNNRTSYLLQNWINNTWENNLLYTYTYDANNNRISSLTQDWELNNWVNSSLHTYTYDINNNRTSLLRQGWTFNNTWVDSSRETYSYDANNNQISILAQGWNGSNWENYMLTNYNYNSNNDPIDGLAQLWIGDIWDDLLKYTFTYDENNNLINRLDLYWNGSDWIYSWQKNTTYSSDNFIITDTRKEYDYTGTLEDGDSTYYYFHTILGEDEWVLENEDIVLYPNPCYGRFSIASNIKLNSIDIYNLFGELVYSNNKFDQQFPNVLNLTNEQEGIFFAKISVGSKVYTRKIIVQ